jgi:hypothetical protein
MLRMDNRARIVKAPWTLFGLFVGRYSVQSGKEPYAPRWNQAAIDAIGEAQRDDPVAMVRDNRRVLWHFHDAFYWEDEGLAPSDVKALVLQRERQRERRLGTARAMMQAEDGGRSTRTPIPSELRRAVYERDGGSCVECGATFDLQYDHILPVSLGGATSLTNLQLLCSDCNKRKSNTL